MMLIKSHKLVLHNDGCVKINEENAVLRVVCDSVFPHEVGPPFLQIICEPRETEKFQLLMHCDINMSYIAISIPSVYPSPISSFKCLHQSL
jgi:hypothetical protein